MADNEKEIDPKEPSLTDRIVNRHMARLLGELEDANCPSIFIDACKSKLIWMRADLNVLWKAVGNPTVDGNGP